VRSFDQGQTWTAPSVIVPNEDFDFNQATMPVVTPTGRLIVTWFARSYQTTPPFSEIGQRIETAVSDNCLTPAPCTFGPAHTVEVVNPQGEPRGYNRGRFTLLNAPYITVDKGRDDGRITKDEREHRSFGNVYITYFDGRAGYPSPRPNPTTCSSQAACNTYVRAADILLSVSTNNGASYKPPAKVNDDPGNTSHVFSSVQVNQFGKVFVTWIDRRKDQANNILNDTWGEVSSASRPGRGGDVRITDVSTDWYTREDARPDYGDYNSSEVINFTDFVSIWADGRFPPGTFTQPPRIIVPRRRATPDAIFSVFHGDD
jgi:hypothetical protein